MHLVRFYIVFGAIYIYIVAFLYKFVNRIFYFLQNFFMVNLHKKQNLPLNAEDFVKVLFVDNQNSVVVAISIHINWCVIYRIK